MSITSEAEPLSKIKSKQIVKLLNSGERLDGRSLLDYRDIQIETGVIDKAEGSAIVSLGNTKVLVGVKVELGEPYPDLPDQGALTVNAEFVPLAYRYFEPGPPDENSIELARVVDRGIREAKTIEMDKLVLISGRLVYVVFVDVYILNHDGNLIDASGLAAIAALLNTKLPKYEVKENGEAKKTSEYDSLPIKDCPIPVTVAKINDKILVDPTLEEENIATAKLTITTTKDGKICAIQKSGIGTFTFKEVLEAQKLAKEKARDIRKRFFKEWCLGE
ncbi:RNA-binding protein [Candidatus Bathyarchaeota archaeon]|nr:MAG: RNA-binding protein [Candidatus Bathyarchaeota archaeon]